MGIVDQWVAGLLGNQTGQQAYDSARSAGASTGRARAMAQNAAKQAGEQPASGMAYDANAAQPSWWQNLVQQTQPAPQANPQTSTPVEGPIVGTASGGSQVAAPEPEKENGKDGKAAFSAGDKKNQKSNYEQLLVDSGLIADPNAMAMPSAEQMSVMSPEEQRQWAADRGAEFADLMLTIGTLPLGGIGAGAAKAASAGARAGRAGLKAAQTAAKSSEAAMKAGGKEAAKIAAAEAKAAPGAAKAASEGVKIAKDAKLPTNSRSYYNALVNADKVLRNRTAREVAAEDIFPKLVPATAAGTTALASPLILQTAGAGGLESMKDEGGPTGTLEGQPAPKQGGGKEKAGKESDNADFLGPMPAEVNEAVQVYGMPLADYMALTQRQQYVDALANDEDLRNYYAETYADQDQWGDLLGDLGYEAFRDIGDRGDYQYKHDLVRDLFGYNKDAEGNAQYGIKGWNDMAAANIPGLKDLDDEEAIQAILDYMWAERIDPRIYSTDAQYAQSKNLGALDSAYYLGQYIGNNYIGNEGTDNFLGSLTDQEGNPLYNLDNDDLGAMFMAANLMNQGITGFDEGDLALANELLAAGGINSAYAFAGDDEDGYKWNYNPKRTYQIADMLAQLKDQQMDIAQNGGRGEKYALNVYSGDDVSSDLIDANLEDDLMGYLEAQTGRKLTRS